MRPYVYGVVRCRHGVVRGEHRNVALLVFSLTEQKFWFRRGDLTRASLADDVAVHVKAWLDLLDEEAQEVALSGTSDVVFDWMRRQAAPTEDTLSFGEPGMGIARDLGAEVQRLHDAHLGQQ